MKLLKGWRFKLLRHTSFYPIIAFNIIYEETFQHYVAITLAVLGYGLTLEITKEFDNDDDNYLDNLGYC